MHCEAFSFEFCVRHLGLSSSATFRRITAARLLIRFPILADYLRDGRLGLTTLVVLRDVLCDERLGEILDRASGRTEEEVRALVAALAPRPAVPDLVRRLPERRSAARPSAEGEPARNLDLFDAPARAAERNFTAGAGATRKCWITGKEVRRPSEMWCVVQRVRIPPGQSHSQAGR